MTEEKKGGHVREWCRETYRSLTPRQLEYLNFVVEQERYGRSAALERVKGCVFAYPALRAAIAADEAEAELDAKLEAEASNALDTQLSGRALIMQILDDVIASKRNQPGDPLEYKLKLPEDGKS